MEFDWYLYLLGEAPDFPPHQCLLDMWESSIARDVLTNCWVEAYFIRSVDRANEVDSVDAPRASLKNGC